MSLIDCPNCETYGDPCLNCFQEKKEHGLKYQKKLHKVEDIKVEEEMNSKIINALKQFETDASLNREGFKARAYKNAISTIKGLDFEVTSASQVKGKKGIGKKILLKVEKILDGTLDVESKITFKGDIYPTLLKITGIGPAAAKELVTVHNIGSLDELRSRQELLNDKQKIGLKYFESDEKRIPREEVEDYKRFLDEIVTGSFPNLSFEVVGSFRRGKGDCGDIDCLFKTAPGQSNGQKSFKLLINHLKQIKFITDELAFGSKKFMGYAQMGEYEFARRIDFLFCPKDEYIFSLLYFTGSGDLNVEMRLHANSKDLTLNEHGLYHIEKRGRSLIKKDKVDRIFETEKEIFDYLGLKYLNPCDRVKLISPK